MKKLLLIILMISFVVGNMTFGNDYTIDIRPDNKEFADFLFKGYDYYQDGYYELAVDHYKTAYDICSDSKDCEIAEGLITSVYYLLASNAYEKDDNNECIKWYKKLLSISPNDFTALINIGVAYLWEDPELALYYFQKAKQYADNQDALELAENNINSAKEILENFDELSEEKNLKALNKTNDTFVYKQYYLYYLDVFNVRKSLPNNDNSVTIAIIDDGIKVDHPDLKNSIWTNKSEKLNGIDDDRNGYVDDYYGWNFVKNSNDITPVGTHGTMIAGIIGATSNNNEGISGIIPNGKIKLMSLIVFGENDKASSEDIVTAINYAIDNGADIINLSLCGEEIEYSSDYDKAIQRANDKGIIIVAAAGNGDETQDSNIGIDTTKNQISPVCNGNYKYSIIGVGSLDKEGNLSSWSNYGNCVDVYTYGESIFSTSSTGDTLYAIGSGTSFSAPIITSIVGLGHLKYGNMGLSDIYYSLRGSLSGNNVNIGRYLDNLGKHYKEATLDTTSLGGKDNGNTVFNDVNNESDLETAIHWMYDNGLTIYNTPATFMSNNYLTREQASKFFVQFASSVLGKNKGYIESYNIYSDIYNADSTLKDYIIYSTNMGLFKGTNGKFMPFKNLTQAQALAVTIRILDGYLEEPSNSWYVNYFYRAQAYGLLGETGIKLSNADNVNITRGDMAIILYNAYKYYTS